MGNGRGKIILHIDMNSYFASVEQQANPFLRGRAVGVCSYLSERGCIIASSIEAKAKGIKTGCRVFEARRLDPDVVLIENEPAKYRSVTEKIFGILREYSDRIEPYSIDEAFIDLTGWTASFKSAIEVAAGIQSRIKKEAGEWLNSSIGLSWTKFLAKFAGDIAPKKGMLVIGNEKELEAVLRGRELEEAWGINTRLGERLRGLGINDLSELKKYDPHAIKKRMGFWGFYLWANVNGLEISQVETGSPEPKSIGHSYCLPKITQDKAYLAGILCKLCEKTGRRLRARRLEAKKMNIFFGYCRGGGIGSSFVTAEKMFATEEINAQAARYLDSAVLAMPVRSIAVSVSRLSPFSGQMSLFGSGARRKDLSLAMDRINDKYGEYAVIRGEMFGLENAAADRIGFRKTGI